MTEKLKFDEELQIVYGEVYAPNVGLDSQGDYMTAEEIRKMAHSFIANGRQTSVDKEHDRSDNQGVVVESFIARANDPDGFIDGAWVVGIHVPDYEVWNMIKKGELNGFSLEAKVQSVQKEIELDVPSEIIGKTEMHSNHAHDFILKFDDKGNLIGGETSYDFGHRHQITKGTITDSSEGHNHRYSFVEWLGM